MIELHDDDPLHFVRLIQFVYTGEFQIPNTTETQTAHPLPLAELLSTGERSAADHAEERDALNILCGLWKLAMKYDILSLRKTVAPLMVDQVLFGSAKYEYNNHKWTHSSLCQSAGKFIKVYELLEPSFSDNQMMKVLESRMARFLVIGKIQMARYGLQTSFMRPYSVVISEDSRGYFTHKDSSTFSNLQTKVSSYLKNSPRFKTKYAEEMEKSLHQALTQNTASWGHRDWAALENHS